jgi:hypothetical protein
MGEKQQRYRSGKLASGWERVELLVPGQAAPWLKAYARALRSAAELGLPMPRFEGMGVAPAAGIPMTRPTQTHTANEVGQASRETASPHSVSVMPDGSAPPSTSALADAFFDRDVARRQQEADVARLRPDFSDGLVRRSRGAS